MGREDFVYEGTNLRAVAFPVGGIGTGHFCILGDGSFHQWQIFNEVNHQAYLPHSFLAIRTKRSWEDPYAAVLISPALHDDPSFRPAPSVSDHVVPPGTLRLARTLPTVRDIRMVGRYPVAELEYHDPALHAQVSLTAFSPMIPLDGRNSGIPVGLLVMHVANPDTTKAVEVSLMASLQNAVGWDGLTPVDGVSNPRYGGNQNIIVRQRESTVILMENASLEESSSRKGEMALGVLDSGATARAEWDCLEELWQDFASDGRLAPGRLGPSSVGQTLNGSIAVSFRLKPGEEREVLFVVGWHFPNRYVNWDQRGLGVGDERSKFWLGNAYAKWWNGALEVVNYVLDNYPELRRKTESFRDSLYATTVPAPVLDAASSQISTIRSPTCFWTEDGRFYGFEGCRGSSTGCSCESGGCCPLNCTHVWNYEQTLSRLYPELERSMRRVDLENQMGPDGRIPHRTVLPLYLPRWHSDDTTSHVYAADGHCGTILKALREYLVSGDGQFLEDSWPRLKAALNFAIKTWDPDDDGVFDGPQWNTYDCHLHGQNTFVTGLYLAALRAMEELSLIRDEPELAKTCRELFERGSKNADARLWNGEYYIQMYDAEKYDSNQYGQGCHSDQLLGQWWAHILGLGHILPRDHVRKALRSIERYNSRTSMEKHEQRPRVYLKEEEGGLLICTWPKGGRPGHVTLYSDEVWTGIEYSVAGLMFFEGMVNEGIEIVRRARARHDGRLRSPWNEVECGDHYARPMSSWMLLEGLSGYFNDAPRRSISFEPKINQDNYRCFYSGPNSWGTYSQTSDGSTQRCRLDVLHGVLELDEVRVPDLTRKETPVRVLLDDERMEAGSITREGGMLIIRISVKLAEGNCLRILSGQ